LCSRYAPVKSAYGIKRYVEETERLYSVLEDGLANSKGGWLVGDKFSVADINVYPWIKSHVWAGVDIAKFPKLQKWLAAIDARPGVQKGLQVPNAPAPRDGLAAESYAQVKEWVAKANAELEEIKKQAA